MGKAMVIVYKISPLTYYLFGHLIKVKHIGLANIILDRRAFTELIQHKASAEAIKTELEKIILDEQTGTKMDAVRKTIYDKLNSGLTSDELAHKALELANNR